MKILSFINDKAALKGKPYSPQEIDAHECSDRIWATIAQCKQEADMAVREAWEKGYRDRSD